MSDKTRVIVTGSRRWGDIDANLVLAELLKVGDCVVVHGGAAGVDSYASQAARFLGFEEEEHPADWELHGRRAGPIRNQKMVDAGADLCLAFPGPRSKGTWDCTRRAREAGIPVVVCGPHGGLKR